MIRKVLIANRGEIAIRIGHTLREMEIEAVAVFTDPDEHSLHVPAADAACHIESYLDAREIVRAAKEYGADAIHPATDSFRRVRAFPRSARRLGSSS